MQPFLEDTRQLDERGDHQAALELVDLWLEEHPGDAEARLLKAQICVKTTQNYRYVGQLLLDYAGDSDPTLESFRRQIADFAWSRVEAGRQALRSRYPDDALAAFDEAMALLPTDGAIPLAAGLALARIQPTPDPREPRSPFGESRRRLSPVSLTAQIEKYLRPVIERGEADERAYEVASATLVHHWQAQGKLSSEALAMLSRVAQPAPDTIDLLKSLVDQVQALALETIANLLRIGLPEKARTLLEVCARAKLGGARLALYEAERLNDQPAKALAAYSRALTLANRPDRSIDVDAARTVLVAAQGVVVKCPHCGKVVQPQLSQCSYCDTSLVKNPLLMDAYKDATDTVLAHAGMAELLARSGDAELAREHEQAALDALPPDHLARRALRDLHHRITQPVPAAPESSAAGALRTLNERGVGAELLHEVGRMNQQRPAAWTSTPLDDRVQVVCSLINAGYLKAAQETLSAAFSDAPAQTKLAYLKVRLDAAVRASTDEALGRIRQWIEAGRPDEAVSAATQALDLDLDSRLLLARGDARLALGLDLAALEDYFAAAADVSVRACARKAAARVLERRWDTPGARALLSTLDSADPEVARALDRLGRRERAEPVVAVDLVTSAVMDDTLTRQAQPPAYQGCFALVVREVGTPAAEAELNPGAADAWVDRVLAAGADFVQVLGALRDVVGGAVFALRTISRPHPQIPERGSVTVALLARISASDEAECHAHALQLWRDIHAILPLAQENVYLFEPVVDEDELRALLTPFEPAYAAEIERPQVEAGGGRFPHPFLPASPDRHGLHWSLLRQTAPAMVTIHLKPARLLPWERPGAANPMLADDNSAFSMDTPLERYLTIRQPWEIVPFNYEEQLASAFLMRVYVAGAAGVSQLLPEITAAALFEPHRAGGGGYTILRAGTARDFDVIRRNLSTLDVESWLPAESRTGRLRYLVGESEAAQVFRLPIPGIDGIPGMTLTEGRPVLPPAGMPVRGIRLGMSVARVRGVPLPVTQADEDRRRHLYLVGKTGVGKSTLMLSLVLQDIEAGRGVFLLDPHGDLCDDVLARIPESRRDDVILLDPSDAERPVGLNILDAETDADRHRVVNEFIGLLIRIYDPHNQAVVGPIFQQNVRNAMLAAMSLPDGTLIDVYRILSDTQYIRRVLPQVKDPLVRAYWEEIATRVDSAASAHWKAEMLPYVLSKFSRFVEDSTLRWMIGQPRTSIDWRGVMDEGKILLVNLAKGRIGQENAQFIGSLALSSVLQAAFRRGETPAARRREFHIYIDEVQNYATPLLATMLSEGRKFGVSLTIANQFLYQLDNGIREAVFGNVGSMVAFRVGAQDAPSLAPEFFPVFSPSDLLNLPQFTACVKLLVDGMAARPFTMHTLPTMTAPDAARAAQIREASRQRYGTDIQDVQQAILRKF